MNKEKLKGLLADLLPQPVTSGKEIIAGDPPEVAVKLSDAGIIIAPYRAGWVSPYELKTIVSNADLVAWNDLPGTTKQLKAFLSLRIDAARKSRKATFKNCTLCYKTTHPEWMHDESICQTCAEKQGVVY